MQRAHLKFIDNRPISYLGVDSATKSLFMFSLIASALLFLTFAFYISRTYDIKNRFLTYFIIGQLGQITAAIFADTAGASKAIHTITAFVLAFSLPLLMRQFTLSQQNGPHYRLFLWLLRLEYLTFIVGIGLFVFTMGVAPLGEALPTAGFDIWIIVLTLVTLKSQLKTGIIDH